MVINSNKRRELRASLMRRKASKARYTSDPLDLIAIEGVRETAEKATASAAA